jgi:hypothetical protein
MKYLLLQLLMLPVHFSSYGQAKAKPNFINPTGSYKLNSKTETRHAETYGYFGEIKIKLLSNSKIAITLFVCKGATAYTSGTIWDTLSYKNNTSIYTTPEYDSTCKIIFTFRRSKIIVQQYQANLNDACGFGHGVLAKGVYRKVSSKIPILKDPAKY